MFWIATSNFTGALDGAFLSRVDVAINVPAPDVHGTLAILKTTLTKMSSAFPELAKLAADGDLKRVAHELAGLDGRRVRKTVSEAMLVRLETVIDPGVLTIDDLWSAARRVRQSDSVQVGTGGEHAA